MAESKQTPVSRLQFQRGPVGGVARLIFWFLVLGRKDLVLFMCMCVPCGCRCPNRLGEGITVVVSHPIGVLAIEFGCSEREVSVLNY